MSVNFLDEIDKSKLPQHVAIIMDGNGRWASQKNKPRVFGHKNGVKSVRAVSEASASLGIKYLTLYAFSTENWNRPKIEVEALMMLLVDTIRSEIETLNKNNIQLKAIGDISGLPSATQKALKNGIEATSQNTGMQMILALNYGGREEIMCGIKKIIEQYRSEDLSLSSLTQASFNAFLYTNQMPDPELLIRTSGETRVSNFLLWQCAYTEFYFTPVLWPDFDSTEFYKAIYDFQKRERRFGKTSDQIKK